MTLNAVAYKRTSSHAQDQGPGVAHQMTQAASYGDEQGFRLLEIFADVSFGNIIERPGLKGMLTAIDRGEINVLIVDDLTRLSRDLGHLHALIGRIRATGVEIHVVSQGLVSVPDVMHTGNLK